MNLTHAVHGQVDIFQDKCQKEMEGRNQREFQERIGQKQTDFMKKYSDLATAKLKFVKEEYEPEMLRRQPGGHGDVSRMPSTKAKPPPTLQERIWPEMPVTPPSVVKKQSAELGRIDKAMKDPGLNWGMLVKRDGKPCSRPLGIVSGPISQKRGCNKY